jgi:hypothetical protein
MFPLFWAPVFAGVCFLVFALVSWVRGQRRRSLALRWGSLGFVAWALCAGFAAVSYQVTPRTFDFWSDLVLAALFLGVCLFVVALVYGVREARRGSGMQRQRS